jgi:flagellar protein FlaJ
MTQKIPILIIPLKISKRIAKRFIGIGALLARLVPGLAYDLKKTDIDVSEREYMAVCFINCCAVFFLFFALLFGITYGVKAQILNQSLQLSFGCAFLFSILIFMLLARYPMILAKKKAELLEKNLVFALKDILLQINAGISLYNALINISKANYGLISLEFEKVTKQVNTGKPMENALEELAIRSESEYLRKTVWQVVNALRAGASLKGALNSIITNLTAEQKTKIRDFAKELNLWSLIYMLFAVAVPSIGATMMVILSSFAGMGITKEFFITFIIICVFVQIIIIGLIKARRPLVHI